MARQSDDDDFQLEDDEEEEQPNPKQKTTTGGNPIKKVDNDQYDEEHMVLSSEQSDIPSNDEGPRQEELNFERKKQGKPQELGQQDDSDQEEAGAGGPRPIIGAYDPAEYAGLNVSDEIKELFKYITRFQPVNIELETKLKAFIPDYIPAVGEVDAFLKMPRPDLQGETLGLSVIDEPALNQSKRSKLELFLNEQNISKQDKAQQHVHSIENAAKNPREIQQWIEDVEEISKAKALPTVAYTKQMPDIESLMQIWPQEIEEALTKLKLPPTEDVDLNLEEYCKMACAIVDIPVHPSNKDRNIICLLYTSPSPRDRQKSRMPSSA
eukprot:TRINITY_DN533_c0_g1_i3.p1 TRINITY_DN533_c0_g1~~TRINITY_DN533_c0_g1_i3.p1  ORF type:complete len:324 (-),score=75.51 TRINITY_DN533_c0_g1_i3:33-1004(-)